MSELYFYLLMALMLILSFLLFLALSIIWVLGSHKCTCKVTKNEG